jgi:DNA-binding LacI/PurR family transcriptional regulator
MSRDKSRDKSKVGKVGLREIASSAGVSISTVSRILNGNIRVDPDLRQVVLSAVTKLGIDLSQRDKTKAFVFLLSNRGMSDAFHSRILLGAEAACVAHGWDILFLSYNYSPKTPWRELHLPKLVQRHDIVRGVILTGTNFENLIELLLNKGITSVILGNNISGDPKSFRTDVVSSDEVQGSSDVIRYLIGLGHRHICYIGNNRLPWFARCYAGYCRAMEEAGLEPRQSSVDSEDFTEIGYLGTKSLLASGEPVSAIFAGNDPTAHGVYKGLRDCGLSIPDDISVVGCNDTVGGMLYPALTTIREFPEQLGKQMVELLLKRISEPLLPPQSVTIPTEFIKRDSCKSILTHPDKLALDLNFGSKVLATQDGRKTNRITP